MLNHPSQLAAPAPMDDSPSQTALQLQACQTVLAQVHRDQSDILWGLSHAMRSPLTAILGFAQLMDAGVPAPTQRQKSSLAQILQAGWGLLALIDEILDASLIEGGKLQLQIEAVSLEDVLRDCETLIAPLARQSDVRVDFSWPVLPLVVAADRLRLRRILMTLLGHALLHSGAAGAVQVSCHRCSDDRLRVHFQDTSCGQSTAWMAHPDPAHHIRLIVSQQLAGLMGGMIATQGASSTAGDASAYWLELNATGNSS